MVESNKLMAEFLGWFYHENQDFWVTNENQHEIYLKFHTDWNWLMQVVEKIEFLNNTVVIQNQWCQVLIMGDESIEVDAESKTQAVYSACLQFIQNESNN